jgi:hypothetical protein
MSLRGGSGRNWPALGPRLTGAVRAFAKLPTGQLPRRSSQLRAGRKRQPKEMLDLSAAKRAAEGRQCRPCRVRQRADGAVAPQMSDS